MNFSATTPSRGRPPPHWVVSGPKKFIFVLFFLRLLPDLSGGPESVHASSEARCETLRFGHGSLLLAALQLCMPRYDKISLLSS